MWICFLLLACGDDAASGDSGMGATGSDGGTVVDGGGVGDGGTTADGGSTGDGGATGTCSDLTWHPDASVFIDTQTEASAFCDSADAVDGDLVIDVGDELDPITELDGIACLCQVTGDLIITGDSSKPAPGPAPTSPPHVTGDIELYNLQRVGGDLEITWHPGLSYVEGLRALTEVGGDLVIGGNPTQQVASFYALQTVGGTVVVRDMEKLLILRLPVATSIGGLSFGDSGDGLTAYYLVEVLLTELQTVTGDLRIVGPRNLGSLQAPALTTVGGALHLQETCQTVPAFSQLTSVGSLHLSSMCAMTDFSGFAALTDVTGASDGGASVHLSGNDYLDADEISAFLVQLSSKGTGALETGNEGSCADGMAVYGDGYCD